MRPGERVIPPAALADRKSRELARVWVANENMHVALATGQWNDPAAWGIALADLARHLARAYGQSNALDEASALARIRAGLDAEWQEDTRTDRTGDLLSP